MIYFSKGLILIDQGAQQRTGVRIPALTNTNEYTLVYRIIEFRRGGGSVAGSTTWLSKRFLTQPLGVN